MSNFSSLAKTTSSSTSKASETATSAESGISPLREFQQVKNMPNPGIKVYPKIRRPQTAPPKRPAPKPPVSVTKPKETRAVGCRTTPKRPAPKPPILLTKPTEGVRVPAPVSREEQVVVVQTDPATRISGDSGPAASAGVVASHLRGAEVVCDEASITAAAAAVEEEGENTEEPRTHSVETKDDEANSEWVLEVINEALHDSRQPPSIAESQVSEDVRLTKEQFVLPSTAAAAATTTTPTPTSVDRLKVISESVSAAKPDLREDSEPKTHSTGAQTIQVGLHPSHPAGLSQSPTEAVVVSSAQKPMKNQSSQTDPEISLPGGSMIVEKTEPVQMVHAPQKQAPQLPAPPSAAAPVKQRAPVQMRSVESLRRLSSQGKEQQGKRSCILIPKRPAPKPPVVGVAVPKPPVVPQAPLMTRREKTKTKTNIPQTADQPPPEKPSTPVSKETPKQRVVMAYKRSKSDNILDSTTNNSPKDENDNTKSLDDITVTSENLTNANVKSTTSQRVPNKDASGSISGEYASTDIIRAGRELTRHNSTGSIAQIPSINIDDGGYISDIFSSIPKPVVSNVKLVKRGQSMREPRQRRRKAASRSEEELDRLNILMNLYDVPYDYLLSKDFRSSFFEESELKRQTVCFNIGDVQTLLKHSKEDQEHVYSLPEAHSYGEDTLKAVKVITDKYNTFERQQMRAMSFREGTLTALRNRERQRLAKDPSQRPLASNASGPSSSSSTSSPSSSSSMYHSVYTDAQPVGKEDLMGCANSGLTRRDVQRIEMFYGGVGTLVVVCEGLCDLYIGTFTKADRLDWHHFAAGVPLLVLDTGEGKRRRELRLVLAERETGFPLWQDKINYLSNYVEEEPGLHTLRMSGSLSKVAKLKMFCVEASQRFLDRFEELTCDPDDDLWKVSSTNSSSYKYHKRKHKKYKMPTKQDISSPCNFTHVTRIDPTDSNMASTFSSFLPPRQPGAPTQLPATGIAFGGSGGGSAASSAASSPGEDKAGSRATRAFCAVGIPRT